MPSISEGCEREESHPLHRVFNRAYTIATLVERGEGPSAFLASLFSSSQFRFKQVPDMVDLAVFLVSQDRLDLLLVDDGTRMFSINQICCSICDLAMTIFKPSDVLFQHKTILTSITNIC